MTPQTSFNVIRLLNKVAWLCGLGLFYYFGNQQDGFVQELWNAAKTASPLAAMLAILLLFDERRERREAQRQCNERTIDFIQSNNVASSAIEKMANAVSKSKGR